MAKAATNDCFHYGFICWLIFVLSFTLENFKLKIFLYHFPDSKVTLSCLFCPRPSLKPKYIRPTNQKIFGISDKSLTQSIDYKDSWWLMFCWLLYQLNSLIVLAIIITLAAQTFNRQSSEPVGYLKKCIQSYALQTNQIVQLYIVKILLFLTSWFKKTKRLNFVLKVHF